MMDGWTDRGRQRYVWQREKEQRMVKREKGQQKGVWQERKKGAE